MKDTAAILVVRTPRLRYRWGEGFPQGLWEAESGPRDSSSLLLLSVILLEVERGVPGKQLTINQRT